VARFLVRRFAQTVVVLFGATILLFVALYVIPGDPIGALDNGKKIDAATHAELARKYHLDKPLVTQYGYYLERVSQGDLGESYRFTGQKVTHLINQRIITTAKLAFYAIFLEILIGISAGVIAALRKDSFWDVSITLTTTLAVGLPVFVVALVLRGTFAQNLHWFPLFTSTDGNFFEQLHALFLPALTLAVVDAAFLARLMRGSMIDVKNADYLRTAFSKGLKKRDVMRRHAFRNALIPVTTYLGIALAANLGGALIIEGIFNVNGIGSFLTQSVSSQDGPVVVGIATYTIFIFVLLSTVVDIAYGLLDPRVRVTS
jgi:oligopeptide transport system permease protein